MADSADEGLPSENSSFRDSQSNYTATTQMHSQQIRSIHCSRSFSSHLQNVPNILGASLPRYLVRVKFFLSICFIRFSLDAGSLGKYSGRHHVMPPLRPFDSSFSSPFKSSAILDLKIWTGLDEYSYNNFLKACLIQGKGHSPTTCLCFTLLT